MITPEVSIFIIECDGEPRIISVYTTPQVNAPERRRAKPAAVLKQDGVFSVYFSGYKFRKSFGELLEIYLYEEPVDSQDYDYINAHYLNLNLIKNLEMSKLTQGFTVAGTEVPLPQSIDKFDEFVLDQLKNGTYRTAPRPHTDSDDNSPEFLFTLMMKSDKVSPLTKVLVANSMYRVKIGEVKEVADLAAAFFRWYVYLVIWYRDYFKE